MVDDAEINVLGQEVFADALRHVRVDLVLVEDARLFVLLEHGPVCVMPHTLIFRVTLLEEAADPANRAAGADPYDEMRDAAVRLFPISGPVSS